MFGPESLQKIQNPQLNAFIPDLYAAARSAVDGGLEALKTYKSVTLSIREKSRGNPVTEADLAANQTILSVLASSHPNDPIRSEESKMEEKDFSRGRLWVVDPLDGTRDFIAQNGEFSIMVGLAVDGKALLGAVFQPDPGVLYLGIVNVGAWSMRSPQTAQSFEPLSATDGSRIPLRFVRSRSHPDPKITALEKKLGNISIIHSGSVGVKCALIAADQADLYVHPVPHLKEWDTCAPEAVLRGAGGKVTDCSGSELTYGKLVPKQTKGIYAAKGDAWNRYLSLVREVAP